ncbi:hypothetical protein ADUPG1_004110, partial [Aduncisulcus paluster]
FVDGSMRESTTSIRAWIELKKGRLGETVSLEEEFVVISMPPESETQIILGVSVLKVLGLPDLWTQGQWTTPLEEEHTYELDTEGWDTSTDETTTLMCEDPKLKGVIQPVLD